MTEWYWRQSSFQGLADVAAATSEMPELRQYSEYCRLLEGGLREQALATLNEFIHVCETWDASRRREFVDWVLTSQHHLKEIDGLIPHPLRVRLVEPTIESWLADEPHNAVPHRWRGTIDGYREAIRLNENEQIARELFVGAVTAGVGYAVHEFPAGYLGNADDDARALTEASQLLEGLNDGEMRKRFTNEVAELRETVERYRRYVAEQSHLSFAEWWICNFGPVY